MSTAILPGTCYEFFDRISESESSVLLLDYDGTISPLTTNRDQAWPYPGVPELLKELIASGVRVVIVSGRCCDDIVRLLKMDELEIWGCHGAEQRHANGQIGLTGDPGLSQNFETILLALEREGLSPNVEAKPASIAVHWRGLEPDVIPEVRAAAKRAFYPFVRNTLTLTDFDGGIELRSKNLTKATVVHQIASEMPHSPIAYLGDDLTDEDAFAALGNGGLTVLVRPEYRITSARLWLQPPHELMSFLSLWLASSRGGHE